MSDQVDGAEVLPVVFLTVWNEFRSMQLQYHAILHEDAVSSGKNVLFVSRYYMRGRNIANQKQN